MTDTNLLTTPRPSTSSYPGCGPEAEFVLAALSVAPDRAERLEALAFQPLCAETILRFSGQGRIGPFLYHRLRSIPGVPAEILEPLAKEASDWTRSALVQARDLIAILQAFQAAAIPTLIYKGPLLAERIYGGLSLRHFRDLDLVVRPHDVKHAAQILVNQGYRREDGEVEQPEHIPERLLSDDCELGFHHPQSRSLVELHWGVTHPRGVDPIDLEALWECAEEVQLLGQPCRAAPAEELWMLLAIHAGEKHRWERMKWVVDLSLLPEAYDLDWTRLHHLAKSWGRERIFIQSLAIVRDLTGLPLPAPLREQIALDSEAASQVAMARGRLFGGEHAPLPGFDEWSEYFRRASEACVDDLPSGKPSPASWPRWRSRLRYAKSILTPGWLERLSLPLPRALRFLHWGYRPLRLVWKRVIRK